MEFQFYHLFTLPAPFHSPIKEIKRVQHNNHVVGHSRTMPKHGYSAQSADHPYGEEDEERFSRFTEYRGGNRFVLELTLY